ncbi:CHRD domain-containing protein [Noviherbaspirillum sedimenti]|uniref:CHRD domain-containing protein n=1 Tax=Noviherbaspirillum sedimenti TaxID=2320865 RepID=A0A3A3FYC1_9BURK|nr:CHRD domain-containing protein [Noviherbaspirillum sedimenti]RJG00365.1 CHRD domain-containing protein [Noviherbaspirillum sedimenti]
MRNFRHWLAAWWLSCVSLLLLSACGGALDAEATRFSASLTGEQEVPPSGSLATGTGVVTVNPENRLLTATVNTAGITGTVAHIHEGARGQNGPVIFPLTQTATGSGVWVAGVTITDAQLATLRAGNYYFNVHSDAFPGGEIRGQIVADQPASGSTTTTTAGGTTTTTAVGGTTTTAPAVTSTTTGVTTTTTATTGETTTTYAG